MPRHATKTSYVKGDPRTKIKPKGFGKKISDGYKKKYPKIEIPCEVCGKKILRVKSQIKNLDHHFCNRDCYNKWHASISPRDYGYSFPNSLKNKIRQRDDFKCQLCGKNETSKRHHDVHHIDYDKGNGDGSNLVTLCNRCHARTNHNRQHWISVFQSYMIWKDLEKLKRS